LFGHNEFGTEAGLLKPCESANSRLTLPVQMVDATPYKSQLSQQPNRLHPAKNLFHAFAHPLADFLAAFSHKEQIN
jgi:hypothetical protein